MIRNALRISIKNRKGNDAAAAAAKPVVKGAILDTRCLLLRCEQSMINTTNISKKKDANLVF